MPTMDSTAAIAEPSRRLRTVVTLALALIPLSLVVDAYQVLAGGTLVDPAGPGTSVPASSLPASGAVLLLAMRALEVAPALLAALALRSLLTGWMAGDLLTERTARLVRTIGLWLVAMGAVRLVTSTASGPLLAGLGALDRTVVHVDIDLTALIVGLTLVCLSHVLAVAARVQRDAELTI
jgi:hypothetical protein